MKDIYTSKEIRCVGLIGHNTTGKTTLAEGLLYLMGELNRLGKIVDGNTASDYHPEEITHKASFYTSVLQGEFNGKKINIIDTPGFSDFICPIKNGIRVSDVVLNVVNATSGVDFGTETTTHYAEEYQIPVLYVLNMLDKENIDFERLQESLKESFSKVVFLQVPLETGSSFNAVLDVLKNKVLRFSKDGKGDYLEENIPPYLQERALEIRQQFIEKVAESDDSLLEKFFEETLSDDDITQGLYSAILHRQVSPVLCCSGEFNIGTKRLLEFITQYIPPALESAIVDLKQEKEETYTPQSLKEEGPVCLYIFKTSPEQAGEMSYFKVYRGVLKPGEDLSNSQNKHQERFSQLYTMNGKNRLKALELHAGDIGAVPRLKHSRTGDTLHTPKHEMSVKPTEYAFPSFEAAIVAKVRGDEEKMANALNTIHQQDPSLQYEQNAELKQVLIFGQGELQIRAAIERMKHQFKVEVELERPRIAYRETIRIQGDAKYRHRKQSGGSGQFAEVWLRVEPHERGAGVEFRDSLVGQNVSRSFVPSVEKGCHSAVETGVISGHRVVDVKIDFYDGKEHPVDSKDIAFQTAGKNAFIEAFKNAKPFLLEPLFHLEIKIPDTHVGDVMGDISGRRGRISGVEALGRYQVVKAVVPKSELYQYTPSLLSMTQGRGTVNYSFSHYEEVPGEVAQKVIEAYNKNRQHSE